MFLRLLSKASLRWRRNQLWCLLCSGQRAAIIATPLPTNGHNKHADGGGDMQMHTITFLTLLPEVLVISQVKPPQRGEQAAAWLLRFLWEWSRRSKKGSLYRTLLSSHSVCVWIHTRGSDSVLFSAAACRYHDMFGHLLLGTVWFTFQSVMTAQPSVSIGRILSHPSPPLMEPRQVCAREHTALWSHLKPCRLFH